MTGDSQATDRPVAIIGGGPVGLAFALELASHGVGATLIEPREVVEHSRPRAKTTSARSMELFRRLGAADEIRRRAAIPVEWSDEIRFCTTVTGTEITRLRGVLGLDLVGSALTSEAAQQITQPAVEEVLRELVATEPLITTRYGSRATDVEIGADGARVRIETDGAVSEFTADYVVGADGSRSVVRPALGAQYVGAPGGRPNVNITFRSRSLAGLIPAAIHHWVLNPEASGVVGPLDLDGTWWAIATGVASIDDDAHAVAIVHALVGADIDVEILATDPWQARLLLSDSYGSGRGFLIGDAAHQNPPWGGHGFNTGVGDAVNLAWKLAAVVNGWAPAAILHSYEHERRPVAEQTIELAASNMRALSIDLASPALLAAGPEGEAARAVAAEALPTLKRAEFYSLGLVLGYGYTPDAVDQTPSLDIYLPIAAPGNRLPHSRNSRDESLFDLLGREFTLLGEFGLVDFRPGAGTERWLEAAASRGIPLEVVDPTAHGFPAVAEGSLVLVRPDQHIAWIGGSDHDPGPILDSAVRGFAR